MFLKTFFGWNLKSTNPLKITPIEGLNGAIFRLEFEKYIFIEDYFNRRYKWRRKWDDDVVKCAGIKRCHLGRN